jgi:hypothetical protein
MMKLGEGVLTWSANERRSDRYGSVYLIAEGHNSRSAGPSPSLVNRDLAMELNCLPGELLAVVTEARDSTHVGDFFRGISPRRPKIGQIIILGRGNLFYELVPAGGVQIGLRPRDWRERASDWLDIRALYDAHEQSVRLFFHPTTHP